VTDAPRYQPYYCEENVWHLAREAPDRGIEDAHVVFISNNNRSVAIWSQRASQDPSRATLWDYHVVLLGRRDDAWRIFDLDCTAGFELDVADWIEASFPFAGVVPPDVAPMFRVVDAPTFLEEFRTDRSHMRDEDGGWNAPPPDWDPPHAESNLWRFVDPRGEAPGQVMDLDAFDAQWG
jgi:hypothetical protein